MLEGTDQSALKARIQSFHADPWNFRGLQNESPLEDLGYSDGVFLSRRDHIKSEILLNGIINRFDFLPSETGPQKPEQRALVGIPNNETINREKQEQSPRKVSVWEFFHRDSEEDAEHIHVGRFNVPSEHEVLDAFVTQCHDFDAQKADQNDRYNQIPDDWLEWPQKLFDWW